MSSQALVTFAHRFGMAPTIHAQAPGRINLIGEHTDYEQGFVFPAAIGRHIHVWAAPAIESSRLEATGEPESALIRWSNVEPADHLPAWSRYPAGVAWAMRVQGFAVPEVVALVDADLPQGAGLSSSAALEMAFATLFRLLANLPFNDAELAALGRTAENQFVGVPCGIMDQTASLFGRAGCALYVDTRTPGNPEPVSLPPEWAIIVANTNCKHELVGSPYAERQAQARQAARRLGVPWLREATESDLEAQASGWEPVLHRRARHIVRENQRVLDFRRALENRDRAAIGELMQASHLSLRDDYEVSTPELDAMAEACWRHPACLGARMMGGGFGGSCIAMVEREAAAEFIDRVSTEYQDRTHIVPDVFVTEAVDGARAEWITPPDASV